MHYDYTDSQIPQPQIIYTLNAEEMQARVDRARRELAGVSLMLADHIRHQKAEAALLAFRQSPDGHTDRSLSSI